MIYLRKEVIGDMSNNTIEKIDKNLEVAKVIDAPDCVFHDVKKAPFKIYGLYNPSELGRFRRIPADVAAEISEGMVRLATHTAGGRVRFSTDSEYVAIQCKMPEITHFAHMPVTGVSGFDMYVMKGECEVFEKTFVPPYDITDGYVSIYHFESREKREITINFPLYNSVEYLYIGLEPDAFLGEGHKYRYETPVVYYGSSITQGGCASRPGNSYEAFISQRLSCDYINLGFSGNAKGEDAMMDYIASLDMSVFVYDYDNNTPSVEHLAVTHEKGFKKIRKAHPELPVIFVSAPNDNIRGSKENFILRREIIFNTYMNAFKAGDRNVYFVDGTSIFNGEFPNSCTVDGCHPNDLGFIRMADSIGRAVEYALNLSKW